MLIKSVWIIFVLLADVATVTQCAKVFGGSFATLRDGYDVIHVELDSVFRRSTTQNTTTVVSFENVIP